MRKRIFIKQMTPAEVGRKKTHEKYIRLPNDFDYQTFFQNKGDVNGNVLQIEFEAAYNGDFKELIPLKFVYYENSNKEKRIPSLKPIFDKYNVIASDIIYLESVTNIDKTTFSLSFKKDSEVRLFTSPIFYEIEESSRLDNVFNQSVKNDLCAQQIYYGAPGTGKSYHIDRETKGQDVVRTTFHPDTDYSTFVGAYKPTTKEIFMRDVTGKVIIEKDQPVTEDRIVYEFVPQAFLQSYIAAWKKYADATEEQPKLQFLVIEEINRGNCAQIFGDLFQLLDRNESGFSDYSIKADADIKKQLSKEFEGLTFKMADKINALYDNKNVVAEVLSGDILLLPNNLYIWATMNTSDQSLFPIDSAFKRRWDWQFMPISNGNQGWKIEVNGALYDWWDFLKKINTLIGTTTSSEDKKLGYFFCKARDGIISSETFVGKVIFYLWNDVFKDYEYGDIVFNDIDGGKLSFDKFYTSDANTKAIVVTSKVAQFLKNLKVEVINSTL